MSELKVLIMGCAGRMGQTLIKCSTRFKNIRLSGAVEIDGHQAIGKDAGQAAGIGELGVAITTDMEAAIKDCDVAIDFTTPASTVAAAALAGKHGKSMVIGTTGLSASDTDIIREAAAQAPTVLAPNMSLGVNLLFALVKQAAIALQGYDIEIVEKHHRHKKDAPSGTAIRLAEKIAEGAGLDLDQAAIHGRSGITDERPAGQLGIHAVRAGDIVGEHNVLFATQGERVELAHAASSRECFAMGALRAATWVLGQKPGLYDMQDMLGLAK